MPNCDIVPEEKCLAQKFDMLEKVFASEMNFEASNFPSLTYANVGHPVHTSKSTILAQQHHHSASQLPIFAGWQVFYITRLSDAELLMGEPVISCTRAREIVESFFLATPNPSLYVYA